MRWLQGAISLLASLLVAALLLWGLLAALGQVAALLP